VSDFALTRIVFRTDDGERRFRYTVDLVRHLVGRELHLRYRRALFGLIWALATPLARLAIFTFVFTRVIPLGIDDYPVYLFTGIVFWGWFAAAVASTTSCAVDRRDLLLRPGVPRAAVPVVSALTDAIDMIAALPVLFVFLMWGPGLRASVLLLPLLMLMQLLLILGLGYALCSLNVYLRDARLVVDIALLLGVYLTPVFFRSESFPERYRFLVQANPMARLLNAYRDVLVEGIFPAPGPLAVLGLGCAVICAGGYAIYAKASPTFVDEL
jgi:lipopolysaccharide transport system permease protein